MNQMRSNTPNLITCLNLLAGCVAVVMAFNLDTEIYGIDGRMWFYICVGAAALFDFCDGFSARMLKAYSPMGKELDSLSDLVSFGVAPGMLMLSTILEHASSTAGIWGAGIALMIPVCGAIRLAKFNVDDSQTTSFLGLPIPANALFWIGASDWIARHGYPNYWIIFGVIIVMSLAMICNVRMFSLKFKTFNFIDNIKRWAILLAAVAFISFYGIEGLAWTIILYILISAFTREKDD
ncbi:MAG: CDP-alcohol phosphatidyltransferase family protein [Bacteroidales bacterium]|nr:CDP-alcohol phosphatidyltransferase family protein [Bacteroidales bacterium]